MSKDQSIVDLIAVEVNSEVIQPDVIVLDDLSLALIGGGNFVVAL
jgi:hypothetical protein